MTGNSLLCFSKQPLDIEMDNYSGLRNRSLKIDLFRLSSLLHSGSSGHPLNFWMTRAPEKFGTPIELAAACRLWQSMGVPAS